MPAQRTKRGKNARSRLPVFLTERERDELLEVAARSAPRGVPHGGLRNTAIIAVGVYAGLRVAELAHLDRADVDLEVLTVLVRQGKGNKDRMVPLNVVAGVAVIDYLAQREDEDPALFVSRLGRRISTKAIRDLVKTLGQDSGLKKNISPHKLRHTFATLTLAKGADVRVVQELLGHESLATTEGYLHLIDGRLRSAVDAL